MDAISKTLRVQWRAGNACNFKCGYCHPSLFDGTSPYKDYPTLKQGFINLKNSTEYYDIVNIELQGGEPTVSTEIRSIITENLSPKFTYTLHTNASADIDWWINSINYFSKLIIAWHPSVDDAHFKQVAKLALKNNIEYSVVINAENSIDNWNRAVEIFEYFKNNSYFVQFKTLFSNYQQGNDKFMPYDDNQWSYYLSMNQMPAVQIVEVESTLYDNYLGNLCWAGVDQIVIDYNGNVFRGWCQSSRIPIGNIYNTSIVFDKTPSVCPMNICKNAFDKEAKKSKNSWGLS
jgi:MoaA/NifB/PqqE/SkfB family radical SAM enzyme